MATTRAIDYAWNTTDYTLRNRNYAVIIRQDQDGTLQSDIGVEANEKVPGGTATPKFVVGSVPESFTFSYGSAWVPAMSGGLIPSESFNKLLALTGNSSTNQVQSLKLWQGAAGDVAFTLTFELTAYSDPIADVLNPLITLSTMAMPGSNMKGLIFAPGPYLDPLKAKQLLDDLAESVASSDKKPKWVLEENMKNKISISVGRWAYFRNVVITNISYELHASTPFRGTSSSFLIPAIETDAGTLMGATVTIQFEPGFAMEQDDLVDMLRVQTGQTKIAGGSFTWNDAQVEYIDLFDPLAT